MLPKIDKQVLSRYEPFYPKHKINSSDKENNISRLKKLREFLENKSTDIEKKEVQRYSKKTGVNSSLNNANNLHALSLDYSLQ
jgi:hypothetical protein